jgi:hypothetical protein
MDNIKQLEEHFKELKRRAGVENSNCYSSISQHLIESIEDDNEVVDWKAIKKNKLEAGIQVEYEMKHVSDFIGCTCSIGSWYFLFEQIKNPFKGSNPWEVPMDIIKQGYLIQYPHTHGGNNWDIAKKDDYGDL